MGTVRRARGWQSRPLAEITRTLWTILTCCVLVASACSEPDVPLPPSEPPLGTWQLTEITGRARVQSGGPGVLCRQGMLELTPKIAPREGPERSHIELENSRFTYDVLFLSDGYYDLLTNRSGGAGSFSGRYGGALLLRADGIWSWPERRLSGSVSTRYDPPVSGSWPPRGQDEDPEPQFRFAFEGEFESATRATGQWSFLERTASGGCWSQGVGRGRWVASWNPPLETGS